MLERLSKSHRNLALFVLAVLLGWFAWTVRAVLNPLILGYLLAYILRPMVQRLQDRGVKRRNAVNIIFVLFGLSLLLILGGVFVQGRQFVNAQVELAQRGEDPFTKAERNLDAILGKAGGWFDKTLRSDAADEALADSEPDQAEGAPSGALRDPSDAPSDAPGEAPSEDADVPQAEAAPGGQAEGADGEGTQGEGTQRDGADGSQPEGSEQESADPARLEPKGGAPENGVAKGGEPEGGSGDGKASDSELTVRQLVRVWLKNLTKGETGETGYAKAQVLLGYVQRVFGGVLSVLGFLLLLPVYTYFLLFELERIHTFVRSHVPKRERERVARIGRRVGSVIANFFRGRLLISVLKGLIIAVGLTLLNVPYGFLLGMFAGIFSLVPFVGPTVGFGLTVLVALQQADIEQANIWLNLGLIVGIFLLAEGIEGYVLVPKILGDSLGLHPVVILVSVFVGGAALGLFGFLIAIPLAATLIILFNELVMPAIEDFAEEDSHTDDGPPGGAGSGEGDPEGALPRGSSA